MKRSRSPILCVATVATMLLLGAMLAPSASAATRAHAAEGFGKLPLYFVENRGQLDPRVAYYVQGSDKTIYFTDQGLTFALQGGAQAEALGRWAVKLDFVGARSGVHPEGQERTGATFSYFKGRRREWQTGLKAYSQVVYRDLWPGIDLVYAGTVNRMKYTFRVRPGADPDQIRLAWRGASGVELKAGELAVTTPAGGFTDERPVSWQEAGGRQVEVATKYRLAANGKPRQASTAGVAEAAVTYGFEVGDYDRGRELVIDPAVLVYAGFLGGSGFEVANGIAVDGAGNAYVIGNTNSDETSFPVTVGPDLTFNSGDLSGFLNVFVAKVNAAGTALVYCGFIGGVNGTGIAVDGAGNAYITGTTGNDGSSFPVTVGPDLTFNGGPFDAFVAKVNATGTALDYCGYIGGAGNDQASAVAVDSAGNAYVAGKTQSDETSFPVAVGPDLTHNGGEFDGFVARVDASGTALDYAGYLGGSDLDWVNGIAVDAAGNAYVTGTTFSDETSFPVKVGPDLTFNSSPGFPDGYVAKVAANGTRLLYAGYIGGSGEEEGGVGIAVDAAGNAYVVGNTASDQTSFPVIAGPDLTFNGSQDAFVAKVSANGKKLLYSGYIGGAGFDRAYGIAVDSWGNAYVAGWTDSDATSFPVTGAPDLTFNDTSGDAFVAKVAVNGKALLYAGYIGGLGGDGATGIAVDGAGNADIAGATTDGTSFPVAVGPDLTFNGFVDAFVAKIAAPTPPSQIAELITQVRALVAAGQLAANKANPLINKLENVADKLQRGQLEATCNQLGAFIHQVEAYLHNGILTAAQGQPLIDGAEAIEAGLGC